MLATVAGADLTAMAGFLAQAAVRKTPVIVDGVIVTASALVAEQLAPGAVQWWVAGHRSVEPAHSAALEHLDIEPILEMSMRLGEGTGAVLALACGAVGDRRAHVDGDVRRGRRLERLTFPQRCPVPRVRGSRGDQLADGAAGPDSGGGHGPPHRWRGDRRGARRRCTARSGRRTGIRACRTRRCRRR